MSGKNRNTTPSDIQLVIPELQTPFECIRHFDGIFEYWYARELMPVMEYTEWRNFERVIRKAIETFKNSRGVQPIDHFVETNNMIDTAKGAKRKVIGLVATKGMVKR
jgi:DNA-damage-inducible protein D